MNSVSRQQYNPVGPLISLTYNAEHLVHTHPEAPSINNEGATISYAAPLFSSLTFPDYFRAASIELEFQMEKWSDNKLEIKSERVL